MLDRIAGRYDRHELANRWKAYLFEHCEIVEVSCSFTDCRDPDDAKFVECAMSCDAVYIVSGDEDLLTLASVDGIEILKPADFLERIK